MMQHLLKVSTLRLGLVFIVLLLSACPFTSHHDSLSITSPSDEDTVSGMITVEGTCSRIDDLTVVIDNDSYTKKVVDCTRGKWSAEFDTSYFQDGDHALVAYKNNTSDQIQITTSNGNLQGYSVTVPVRLADGIYDEIDDYTPLYVYARKISSGLITAKRYTSGSFPGEFELPNLLNGVYEIGAFLDRNGNQEMDEGFDFAGVAGDFYEQSNGSGASSSVELNVFAAHAENGYEPGIYNPGDATGSVSIESPIENETVIGTLHASGFASGSTSLDNIQVSIDNNQFTSQIIPKGVTTNWYADFDTTRLQDGLHFITARINSEIEDTVYFTTDNSNLQGYNISVSVQLTPPLYGEISSFSPLMVYVEDTVTGARQVARFESGDFSENSAFVIENVPNNSYKVGAYFDTNNNGVQDSGEYSGYADNLLNVWYADATAEVVLHGNEVHIASPAWGTEIRANSIDITGNYLGEADEIEVSMRLTGATYRETVSTANFNAGDWNATLDISDVTQEGTRWLHVKAKYGGTWEWDSIQIILNRNFPRGVTIEVPENNATIQTSSFTTSGSYDGEPNSVLLLLDRGEATEKSVQANIGNSAWSASFTDLTGVQTGLIPHTLTAVADYGGGIFEEDEISIYISPIQNRSISISTPSDGETVTTDYLQVQGTYDGTPQSITVNFETGANSELTEVLNNPSNNAWSVNFSDLSSVINGQRVITATADYGGGDNEVDSVSVIVNRPVSAVPLTVTVPSFPWYGEGCGEYFIISDNNELYSEGGLCPVPAPATGDYALLMSLLFSDTEADFDAVPGWTLISRDDDGNPVDESEVVTYILQRDSSGYYYEITIGFAIWSGLGGGLQYEIDRLEGWNCGTSQSNCP